MLVDIGYSFGFWLCLPASLITGLRYCDASERFEWSKNDGMTPLHHAVEWSGHFPLVELLLNRGADISARRVDGRTPLHGATAGRDTDVVQLLLNRGADVNAQAEDGKTPLHLACKRDNESFTEDILQLLLSRGADISARMVDGRTPLHRGCERGNRNVEKLLQNHGANVSAKTTQGETPLDIACRNNNLDVAWVLVRQNPWSNCPIDFGFMNVMRAKPCKQVL